MSFRRSAGLLIAGLVATACAPDPAAADRHVRQARAQIERQQYALALQELEQALAIDPKHLHARFHKGEVLYNTAKLDEAGELFAQLRKEYPGDLNVTKGLAMIRKDQGRFREATELYAALPITKDKLVNQAECLIEIGRSQDAAAITAELLSNDPWFQRAYLIFSKCEEKRGRSKQGKVWADYYRSLEKFREKAAQARGLVSQGKVPEAQLAIGRNLYKHGRLYQAMVTLNQATQVNPNLAPAFLTIGKILRETGRSKDAVKAIEKALALPKQGSWKADKWKAQLDLAKKQVAADAGKEKSPLEIARAHATKEDYDQARAVALFEAKRDTANIEALRLVGTYFNRPEDLFIRLWAWRTAGTINPKATEFLEYVKVASRELLIDLTPAAAIEPGAKGAAPKPGPNRPPK